MFKSIYQIAAAAAAAARKQRESERLSNKSSSTVDSAFHKNHETSSNSICLTKSQEGASEDKISAASQKGDNVIQRNSTNEKLDTLST